MRREISLIFVGDGRASELVNFRSRRDLRIQAIKSSLSNGETAWELELLFSIQVLLLVLKVLLPSSWDDTVSLSLFCSFSYSLITFIFAIRRSWLRFTAS